LTPSGATSAASFCFTRNSTPTTGRRNGYASVTREFLRQTARAGVAEATLARTDASVRHFARWIHFKVQAFPLGCPTDGVRPSREPEPQWKGLSRADELRLLAAAQTLRIRPSRVTSQGLRDHAAIVVLLGSGLDCAYLNS
jgi:site-specific recombinase XerC